jgi:tetratricopeptide (TPR) repeat protein
MKTRICIGFIILFTNALAQDTTDLVARASQLYKTQKYADAEILFERVLKSAPKNIIARYDLGLSKYKSGKYRNAIDDFLLVNAQSQNKYLRAASNYNIGVALIKVGELKKGIVAFKNTLKINPDDSLARDNLQLAMNELKQLELSASAKNNSATNQTKKPSVTKSQIKPITPVKQNAADILSNQQAKEKALRDSISKSKKTISKEKLKNDW